MSNDEIERMSAAQIFAFEERYRRQREREDYKHGALMAMIANVNGGKKNGGLFKPHDFMPGYEPPEQELDEQLSRLATAAEIGE